MEKTQKNSADALVFWLECKKLQFLQIKSWFYFALGNWRHHWWTLGPLPYDLNYSVIKSNKIGVCWTLDDWGFFFNYEKSNYKMPRGTSLDRDAPG